MNVLSSSGFGFKQNRDVGADPQKGSEPVNAVLATTVVPAIGKLHSSPDTIALITLRAPLSSARGSELQHAKRRSRLLHQSFPASSLNEGKKIAC